MTVIDLGGGTRPHPRADIVIDLHHPVSAPAQDAASTPWAVDRNVRGTTRGVICDGEVDEIVSSHFLEHIPSGQPLLDVMNEAWRVLRPGGTFTAILPIVGHTHPTHGAIPTNRYEPYADPTHVSHWWLPERLHHFTGQIAADAEYGIDLWEPGCRYIEPTIASYLIEDQRFTPVALPDAMRSWWTVRGGWEGCFRLVKPEGDE